MCIGERLKEYVRVCVCAYVPRAREDFDKSNFTWRAEKIII